MECKNCHQHISESDKFCRACGGRVVSDQLTYGYLFSEFTERFLNIENNLVVRTLKDLFIRPEEVIDGYVQGTRKRHLNPANYLALAITVSGLQIFLMKKFFSKSLDMSWMIDESNPMSGDTSVMDFTLEYQALFFVLLIPLYAFIAKVTFLNYKKYSYLEHIVITTYTQAHLSLVMFIPALIVFLGGMNFFKYTYFIGFPFMVVYSAYCYKRLYGLSLKQIILKLLLFLLIGGVIYFGVLIAVTVLMIITGALDIQQMIEAEQAKQGITYIASSVMNWTS